VLSSDGGTAFVTSGFSPGVLLVIDTATNAVTGSITVGQNPQGVAISADGGTVWVVNVNDGSLSVIDTATSTVTTAIPIGSSPFGVAVGCISPPALAAQAVGDGRSVSVSGSNFPAASEVTVTLGSAILGTATTDVNGGFTAEFAITDCAVVGGSVTATAGTRTATTDIALDPCAPTTTTTIPDSTTTPDPSPTAAPAAASTAGTLPATGAEVAPLVAAGMALVASGTAAAALSARRRFRGHPPQN
jgi:YVTN family beta-propeller protein